MDSRFRGNDKLVYVLSIVKLTSVHVSKPVSVSILYIFFESCHCKIFSSLKVIAFPDFFNYLCDFKDKRFFIDIHKKIMYYSIIARQGLEQSLLIPNSFLRLFYVFGLHS